MHIMILLVLFLSAMSLNAAETEAQVKLADEKAATAIAERVQKFLQLEGTDLLAFERLGSWFPPDVEKMAADKSSDFQEITEEYKALQINMKKYALIDRIKRALTERALDFAVEPCDLDADGLADAMIQDNRGFVFFFDGKGSEPVAAMQAPVMSSTEEDMNPTEPAPENIVARMKFSVEDGCLYLGYEPNSGAISSFRFKDGKLVEDLDSMEPLDP